MTLKELSQYQSLIKEIKEQEDKLDKLIDKEVTTVAGKVKSSMDCFPYTEIRVSVEMEDPKEAKAKNDQVIIKERRIANARALSVKIEQYIASIADSELRRIFEMRFKDGLKVREIAIKLNMDRSTVGKKIVKYLNNSPNSPK